MPARSSLEKAICLSVRLSVKRVHFDKTEEKSVQIFTPYERSFNLVFWKEEWLVGTTPSTWNFPSTGPCWSESDDFELIFAVAPQLYYIAKKVELTLMEVHYALSNQHKMIILRGLQNAKRPFFV